MSQPLDLKNVIRSGEFPGAGLRKITQLVNATYILLAKPVIKELSL